MKPKPNKQAKPVKAWAMTMHGHLRLETICPSRIDIEPWVYKWQDSGNDARVVRVEIRIIGGKK